jgi:hypothetical protein
MEKMKNQSPLEHQHIARFNQLQVGQIEKEEGEVQHGRDQAKECSIHGGWIVRIQHWV